MSKYNLSDLWEERYGDKTKVSDYAGREMMKAAIGDMNSKYHPTIDHIRPLSKDGADVKENITICNVATNREKGDTFSTWKTNGRTFQAKRKKGNRKAYKIVEINN